VIAKLKIVYAHQLLNELKATDKKEVIVDIRNEFKRLYFDPTYVGLENAQIVMDYDKTDSTILF
jgi:inhibitor of KinA sporulation pathway (predicted exonuclease)